MSKELIKASHLIKTHKRTFMSAVTTDASVRELLHERLGTERADWLLYNALQGSEYHVRAIAQAVGGNAWINHMKRLEVKIPAGNEGEWNNEVLFVRSTIPEMIRQEVIGQPLGKVVEGAGLEHRLIKDIIPGLGNSSIVLDHAEIADYDIPLSSGQKALGFAARIRGRIITSYRKAMAKTPTKSDLTYYWLMAGGYPLLASALGYKSDALTYLFFAQAVIYSLRWLYLRRYPIAAAA